MEAQKVCPGCGGSLEFDPECGKLACKHCGESNGEISGGETVIENEDFVAMLAKLEEGAETAEQLLVDCSGCGAEITLEENVVASRCPYCNSPIIAAAHSSRRIRPAALLPFRLSVEEAGERYRKWLSSRWFLPGSVKREAKLNPPGGIYLPHWIYNTAATTVYTGARGEYYYVTVSYTATENGKTVQKTRQERRTRWYPAAGTVDNRFHDLLVPGTKSLPEDQLQELTPWDLQSLQPYEADFIRGFREESYSVPLADGFVSAQAMMKPEIVRAVESHIGGDTQRVYSMSISYHDMTFKHILLPVWSGSFQYRGKRFPFLINARTGEVQGRRPYSVLKIILLILALVALIGGACYYFAAL